LFGLYVLAISFPARLYNFTITILAGPLCLINSSNDLRVLHDMLIYFAGRFNSRHANLIGKDAWLERENQQL